MRSDSKSVAERQLDVIVPKDDVPDDPNDGLTDGLSEDCFEQINNITPPDDIITSEVLRRLREGDHESYQKVYLHWRKPVYNFVLGLTGNEDEAEDITQEIFAVLWNYRGKIDPNRNIRAFLFLVARRTAYKSNRASRIRQKYASSVWTDECDYVTSYDVVVEKEIELLKQALLQRMPPQQRKIFEMSYNGLSAEDIAEQLGIKRESVYNQLSMAKRLIRNALILIILAYAGRSYVDSSPPSTDFATVIPC